MKSNIAQRLTREVWKLIPGKSDARRKQEAAGIQAYWEHYEDLLNDALLVSEEDMCLSSSESNLTEILKVVQTVQTNFRQQIPDIRAALATTPSTLLRNPADDAAVVKALDLAIRLWLFLPLDYVKSTAGLGNAIASKLQPDPAQSGYTSLDFSAKNLMRKGGIIFRPTSDLSQHLVMEDTEPIVYVFRHASILKLYQQADHSTLYPSGFLLEVERTLQLLFPTFGNKSKTKTRHYVRKFHSDFETDVELGLQKLEQISLAAYPYFGKRLADVQQCYNNATPRHIRQWWFDRRKRVEWATLVVAVVVFILTVFFGIISSVTGIMQVYASFKWH